MIDSKNKVNSIFFRNLICSVFSIIVFFCISIKQSNAFSHEWVGVPQSEYGEQLWDRQSIKRNEDGSVRVLSLSLIHIPSPRDDELSRMPSSA